jgi:hypothetical protein
MKGRLFQPRFRSGRQRAVFVLQVLRGFGASENWRHLGIPVGVTAIRCGVLRSESLAIAGKNSEIWVKISGIWVKISGIWHRNSFGISGPKVPPGSSGLGAGSYV